MTEAEHREFRERQRVSDEDGTATEYASQIAGFAGTISHHAGESFDYQFTSLSPSERDKLERLFPEPSRLRIVLVDHSLAELKRGVEDLRAYLREDIARGDIIWLGPDIAANAVTIGIYSDAERKRTSEELRQVTGVPVRLEISERTQLDVCTSRTNCDSPQRAGVRIVLASLGACNSGYIVRTTTNNEMALTAGHCWHGFTSGTVTSGAAFGTLTNQSAYGPSSSADARLVETVNSTTNNWLYHTSNPARSVGARHSVNDTQVGDLVCLQGYPDQSPVNCGTVTQTFQTVQHPPAPAGCGCTIHNQYFAGYFSDPGNSGGPVGSLNGYTAVGVHSGRIASGTQAMFTHIAFALSSLNLANVSFAP